MKEDSIDNYVRIGTDYYRKTDKPSAYKAPDGSHYTDSILVRWSVDTLRDDFGKHATAEIDKFYGFVTVPEHVNYSIDIAGFYNQYHRIEHKPHNKLFTNTLKYLKHIFGEQLSLGLDYLTLLYIKPTERLPILTLVSEERNTGKSTFVFWLKEVFQKNCTINSNEDFESRFNADWANKLLICVEETLIEKRLIYERIKSLSTSGHYKSEQKGKDRQEVEFFGKFVLCSNYETTFVPLDMDEDRFWVRKIKPFKSEERDPNLLEKLKSEIPHFLGYLLRRYNQSELRAQKGLKPILQPKKNRMWFDTRLLVTDALIRAKQANRPKAEREILALVQERMETHQTDTVEYTAKDLFQILTQNGMKYDRNYIESVLKDRLGLSVVKNSSYRYYGENDGEFENRKGRFFRFTFDMLGNDAQKETVAILKNEMQDFKKMVQGEIDQTPPF